MSSSRRPCTNPQTKLGKFITGMFKSRTFGISFLQ
jgi:hypothetical protein